MNASKGLRGAPLPMPVLAPAADNEEDRVSGCVAAAACEAVGCENVGDDEAAVPAPPASHCRFRLDEDTAVDAAPESAADGPASCARAAVGCGVVALPIVGWDDECCDGRGPWHALHRAALSAFSSVQAAQIHACAVAAEETEVADEEAAPRGDRRWAVKAEAVVSGAAELDGATAEAAVD